MLAECMAVFVGDPAVF